MMPEQPLASTGAASGLHHELATDRPPRSSGGTAPSGALPTAGCASASQAPAEDSTQVARRRTPSPCFRKVAFGWELTFSLHLLFEDPEQNCSRQEVACSTPRPRDETGAWGTFWGGAVTHGDSCSPAGWGESLPENYLKNR